MKRLMLEIKFFLIVINVYRQRKNSDIIISEIAILCDIPLLDIIDRVDYLINLYYTIRKYRFLFYYKRLVYWYREYVDYYSVNHVRYVSTLLIFVYLLLIL